ncbi:hypothetical protein NS226_14980 [Aureimonas ureilytica]|uniref:Uncharacterized protein n=1 Tax=Aureimonas ureilytica TaxID=401562 RepID=A0A175R5L0_9HYPH|nr:hypothetical protein [Aureimonas ureilytica]KTQ92608.1 hypothetical protein NS226_14980 [Aureimonas ureilytica]
MKQVRFSSLDPNLVIDDLDALGEGAQVISLIAAASFGSLAAPCATTGEDKNCDYATAVL